MAGDDREAFGRDLEASLRARESVGSEYDDAFVDAIVERIDTEVERRVQRRVSSEVRRRRAGRARGYPISLAYVSLALGLPITGAAGAAADVEGIIAAWAGIAVINALAATRGLWPTSDER